MTNQLVGEWVMRAGDRLPMLSLIVEDDDGHPVDLTGGKAFLQIRPEDGSPALGFPAGYPEPIVADGWLILDAYIYDPPNGLVVYDWPGFQTAGLITGVSEIVISVAFPDGTHLTSPSDRSARLVVRPAVLPPTFGVPPPGPAWYDDFERADGAIGPNWVPSLVPGWDTDIGPFIISDGAAIASSLNDTGPPRITSSMYWHEAQGADQSIEVEITDVFGNDGYLQLYTHANATDHACNFADFFFSAGGVISGIIYHFDADGSYEGATGVEAPGTFTEPVRVRFEADADGSQRVYVNGVLFHSRVDASPRVGSFVGMGLEPHADHGGGPFTSPRILSAGEFI